MNGSVNGLAAGESLQLSIDGINWTTLSVSNGTWSYIDSRTLSSGDYTYQVRAIDSAGNVSTPVQQLVKVDTTAPTTAPTITITSDSNNDGFLNSTEKGVSTTANVSVGIPANAVAGDVITVSSGATVLATYVVGTGAGQVAAGSTQTITVNLPAEGQTLTVNAAITDAAGNTGSTSSDSLIVDATAPGSGTLSLSNFTDNGSSNSDRISNDNTYDLSLSGQGTPSTIVYQRSNDGGNSWTATTTAQTTLADGIYQYRALVSDAAGNTSISNIVGVTVDTTAPTTAPTITITSDSNNDGFLNSTEKGASTTANVSVGIPANAVAGDVITVSSGATVLATYVVGTGAGQVAAGSTQTTTVNLPAEGQTLTVNAAITDAAGNVGSTASDSIKVDTLAPTTAPTITITSDSNNDGFLNSTEKGASTTANVSVGIPVNAVAGDVITVSSGATVLATYVVGTGAGQVAAGSTQTTTASLPAEGQTLTVTASIQDVAGNTGSSINDSLVVDTTAPGSGTLSLSNFTDNGSSNSDSISNDNTYDLSLSGQGTPSTIVYQRSNDGGTTWNTTTTAQTTLADGIYQYRALVSDAAGNTSISNVVDVTVDTIAPITAPTISISSDTNNDGFLNSTEKGALTTANVSVGIPANAVAGDVITVSSGATVLATYVVGTGAGQVAAGSTQTTTVNLPAEGQTLTVNAAIRDAAGNTGSTSSDSIVIDTVALTAATVTPVGDANKTVAEATAAGGVITVNAANGTTSTVTLVGTNGTVTKTVTNNGTALPVTLTAADLTTLGNGFVQVTTVTRDAAGNTVTTPNTNDGDFTLDTVAPTNPTVVITEGPIIKAAEATSGGGVPVDVTIPSNAAVGDVIAVSIDGVAVGNRTLTATDIANPNTPITFTIPTATINGATVGQGAALVTTTVTDVAGNITTITNNLTIDTVTNDATITNQTFNNLGNNAEITAVGGWTFTGSNGAAARLYSDNGSIQFFQDAAAAVTQTLTYNTNLNNLNFGQGRFGAGQVELSVSAGNGGPANSAGNASTFEVLVAGVVYATITTSNGQGTVSTITYNNGAAGNLTALNVGAPGSANTANAVNVLIDLPANVAASGQIAFRYVSGVQSADDFAVNNVRVLTSNSAAPISIDLNGDGVVGYSHVNMDLRGDGNLSTIAWTDANDGVLVWDKFADGKVHNASQFEFTQYGGSTDLEGLAKGFDTNHDGVFDAQDEKFNEFAVWRDADQDGVSDAGELLTLAQLGISGINLSSDGVVSRPTDDVVVAGNTTATLINGQTLLVQDAAFAYAEHNPAAANQTVNLVEASSDLVLFNVLNSSDATGGNGHDSLNNFKVSSGTNADVIDVKALLSNSGIESGNITDYLTTTQQDGNTTLSIDRDGSGTAFASTQLLTLNAVSTDLQTLLANQQIIIG